MDVATAARTPRRIKITPLGKKEEKTHAKLQTVQARKTEKKKLIGIAIASMIM